MAKVLRDDPGERYEKLYGMLMEAIPSSILLIDRSMRIVFTNRNFLERSKRQISSTVGQRLEAVFPPIIFDHMDIARRIREVFEKGQPTRGERMTYRAPGLPMRIYYYRIHPFSWGGAVENAVLLMDDVTEQVQLSEEVRRTERHLASVVESANDIVLSTDTEGRVLTWNTAAERISGYVLYEVKERFFFEFCAANHREDVKRLFIQKTSNRAEWHLVSKSGSPIPVSWVFSPMKDDQARTVGIVAVGRDLTEHRKLERQLLQSEKLAALGVMAGGIAHELRNPLAVCSSAAQFLIDDDVTPAFRKECAAKIYAGVQRAAVIIENLLRFGRPSSRTDMAPLNLLSVLKETLALVANQAKVQNIELVSDFPEKAVPVSGIASLLQQVFINLFLNAIHAMPNGGALRVSAETLGSETIIHVADTGCGISKADIGNIFDPFYTTSPVGKGTGLGLSLCYSIVKQHFGSIEVDSVEGTGSRFTVRLPLL